MYVAKNKEKELRHGWFVVRNRTAAETAEDLSPLERHNREEIMFDKSPWNQLDPTRRGTQMLKQYLAQLLCTRMEKAFTEFLTDIRSRRQAVKDESQSLGPARATIEEKRQYLTRIAEASYSASSQSLRGRYEGLTTPVTKIRMQIREINDNFAIKMKKSRCVAFVKLQDTAKKPVTQPKRLFDISSGNIFDGSTAQPAFKGFGANNTPRKVSLLPLP